jgi:predicted GH43/DUF377 family glycosyl hydrolase
MLASSMSRHKGNPILKPIADHPWESRMVFNAAAVTIESMFYIVP